MGSSPSSDGIARRLRPKKPLLLRRFVTVMALLGGVMPAVLVITASRASATAQLFTATLSGGEEVPPNGSAGTGTGVVYLNAAETQITVDLSFTGLGSNATGAHIHGPAAPGVNAAILFDLAPVPAATSGSITTKTFAITAAQVTNLRAGLFYFNVHTTTFGGGEIRGQIGGAGQSARLYIATLNGVKEVPTNASTATGIGTVYLNAAENLITVDLRWTGLSSNANGAHIHGPAAVGVNAGILFPLVPPAVTAGSTPTTTFTPTAAQVTQLKAGQLYFNLHSTAIPGGEIRGQIFPSQSLPAVVRTSTEWLLRDSLSTGSNTTPQFSYGARPLIPLMGDWNANGSRTIGIYKSGAFDLRNSNTAGVADSIVNFASDPRGFPISGDFNGDDRDDLAVYRNGLWQVRLSTGATFSFSFGTGSWPGTIPVVGDWDGNGTDGIGTYTFSTATWNLRNTATAGVADAGSFVFGTASATYPVVGDWNSDGVDTVGVKTNANSNWSLRNTNGAGTADLSFSYGLANELPLSWR